MTPHPCTVKAAREIAKSPWCSCHDDSYAPTREADISSIIERECHVGELVRQNNEMREALAGLTNLIRNIRDIYGNKGADFIIHSTTFVEAEYLLAKVTK